MQHTKGEGVDVVSVHKFSKLEFVQAELGQSFDFKLIHATKCISRHLSSYLELEPYHQAFYRQCIQMLFCGN